MARTSRKTFIDIQLEEEVIRSCKDSIAGCTGLVPRTTPYLEAESQTSGSWFNGLLRRCMRTAGHADHCLGGLQEPTRASEERTSHNRVIFRPKDDSSLDLLRSSDHDSDQESATEPQVAFAFPPKAQIGS